MEIKKLQDHILEQQQVIAKYYGETLVLKKQLKEANELIEENEAEEEKYVKMFANWLVDEGYLMDAEKVTNLDINEVYNYWNVN